MKADNFCYWLQGFMELGSPDIVTEEQLSDIKAHLRIVFKYDIDLSYGNKTHQQLLSSLHGMSLHVPSVNC